MSTAMEKNPNTNPAVTVAQTAALDPRGPRAPVPPPAPPQGGGLPNIVVILRRALAHWPVAAVFIVIGALVTVQVIRSRKPIYKSETVIFYRPGVLSGDGAAPNESLRSLGTKLKEMLLAQSNLKKVIDDRHLYADVVETRGYADAVDLFRKQIDFKPRSNDTFLIAYQGKSREEAQAVTARLADSIVEGNAKVRQDRAKETTEFLDAEKKRVDGDLDRLEKELAQFMTDHPEFVTEGGDRGGATVRAQQKKVGAAAATDRAAARRRAIAAAGVVVGRPVSPESPRPAGAAPTAPPVDPVLIAARTQAMSELIAAKKELSEKSVRFTEAHPDVRAASARVSAAEATVQKAEDAIMAAKPPPPPPPPPAPIELPDPYEDKTAKPAAPKASAVLGTNPGEAETRPVAPAGSSEPTLVSLETEWSRLTREVGKVRQQQSQLDTKLFHAEMAASSEIGGYAATIAILDPAYKPAGPTGASSKMIALGGAVASFLFGIAMAMARGVLLDDRLFDASEIEGLGLVPVLGVVPRAKAIKPDPRGRRA